MTNHLKSVPLIALACALIACGSDAGNADEGYSASSVEESSAAAANGSNAKVMATPASINLDPCTLMDEAALADLEITKVAEVSRHAGVEPIFNTSTKAPYVDCSWASKSGPPSMHIRVYDAPGIAQPSDGVTPVKVGDGGWLADEDGRVRLYAKTGDRLVRLSPQAPKYYSADDATYLSAIFAGVASRLGSPATAIAGPEGLPEGASICASINGAPSTQAFGGELVALPISHRVIDPASPDAEWGNSSGCHWVELANNRYSVTARFLDDTARAYVEKSNSRGWQDVEIASREARLGRDNYLIDMGEKGTLEVSGGIRVRDALLEDAATNIVTALGG